MQLFVSFCDYKFHFTPIVYVEYIRMLHPLTTDSVLMVSLVICWIYRSSWPEIANEPFFPLQSLLSDIVSCTNWRPLVALIVNSPQTEVSEMRKEPYCVIPRDMNPEDLSHLGKSIFSLPVYAWELELWCYQNGPKSTFKQKEFRIDYDCKPSW